jgi:DNA-binding HxlR family transcriptional regulator
MSSSIRTKASGETKICPIEEALDILGDAWSMLILRDAGTGIVRFDEFRKNLSIAPNILTQRLAALTGAGLLVDL